MYGQSRAVLFASIDAAIAHALFLRPDDGDDLFSDVLSSIASPKYSPGAVLSRMTILEYEREVLGFYLSEHPAMEAKKSLGGGFSDISLIGTMADRGNVKIVGLIRDIKRIRTKKGKRWRL